MPLVTDLFNTADIPADLAKKSFAAMIARMMPNGEAPLFGMSALMGEETAVQTEHGFFQKTMVFPQAQVNGAITSGVTALVVDSNIELIPGMLMIVNSTSEIIRVEAVNANGTGVTITRGVGGGAATIPDNELLYQVGTAFPEASDRPLSMTIAPVKVTNLTQIFRNTWSISGTSKAIQNIAGSDNVAESRIDCAAFHASDIERALFWGKKSSSTLNGQPFRTMDGLINMVSTLANYPSSYSVPNVFTAGGTTTYDQLEGYLDPVFNQNTDPKVGNVRTLFVGGTALRVLNNIGRLSGEYQIVENQTSWGMKFRTFHIARGTFNVVEHPQFNTNATWSKMAVAVDMSTFKLAYLNGRKTENKEFNMEGSTAQDDGIDAVGGTLTSELTAVCKNIPANAVIKGLTAAA